jgi:DNA polymerase
MKTSDFFKPASEQRLKKGLEKGYSCTKCGLYSQVHSPRMQPYGKFKKGIMNIGEAPGETEDRRGRQWQGKMGSSVLRPMYEKLGIDLFEDCININAINCRPTSGKGNRAPTDQEIACCRSKVLKAIEEYKPKVIVLHGGAAVKSLIGYRWKKDLGGISKWRGWTIPDRDVNAWICPTFHPSHIDRQSKYKEVETIWKQDLKQAFSMLNQPFPEIEDESRYIEYIKDQEHLDCVLESLALGESDLTCFDFETTGLKPHAKGHKIVCMSIAKGPKECYAFMMPNTRDQRVLLRRYFASMETGKIAFNMKFENNWAKRRLNATVKPWVWDGMLAAHVLDNREGICSLKFQTYINFGVVDYDAHIAPYLKGKDPKSANSFNRIFDFIDQYGEDELLKYCGLDSIYEYKLALKQMEQLGVTFNINNITQGKV